MGFLFPRRSRSSSKAGRPLCRSLRSLFPHWGRSGRLRIPFAETNGEGGIRTHVTRKEPRRFRVVPVTTTSVPLQYTSFCNSGFTVLNQNLLEKIISTFYYQLPVPSDLIFLMLFRKISRSDFVAQTSRESTTNFLTFIFKKNLH